MFSYPETDALDSVLASHKPGSSGRHAATLVLDKSWRSPGESCREGVTYTLSADNPPTVRAEISGSSISLDDPAPLVPAVVAKPWGREIWFTGIETRGESAVRAGSGQIPLSTYFSLAPARLTKRQPVVLLKVLDPLPLPVTGELYFEMHRHKHEVYVVTSVDPALYPEGTGAIRLGMNQELRNKFADDKSFRASYLDAVNAYEAARRAVDEGVAKAGPQEAAAREKVLAFSSLVPLRVGDVIEIPAGVPHSLQPGVRVIEVQTPVYERQIIWFAQKTATQDRWDSAAAIGAMSLDPPAPAIHARVAEHAERIAAFAGITLWRIELDPGRSFGLPSGLSYAVCCVVSGVLDVSTPRQQLTLGSEEAALIPASAVDTRFSAITEPVVFLLAAPEL